MVGDLALRRVAAKTSERIGSRVAALAMTRHILIEKRYRRPPGRRLLHEQQDTGHED